jgi:hypothetical protein
MLLCMWYKQEYDISNRRPVFVVYRWENINEIFKHLRLLAHKIAGMKNSYFGVRLLLALSIITASCEKTGSNASPVPPDNGRTIRFVLYTDHDFSDDNSVIHFSIFIKKGSVYVFDTVTANILFDSTYTPRLIKDIPDPAHKIIVEKKVIGYNDVDLTAGFVYEIENVGSSWYVDTSKAGNPLKVIEYNFR